ncbi:hypothetical protein [Salmonella phage Tennessee]
MRTYENHSFTRIERASALAKLVSPSTTLECLIVFSARVRVLDTTASQVHRQLIMSQHFRIASSVFCTEILLI